MKKFLKITLVSLGSLLALLLVAVGIALWLVFTPARLTSIVNKLSDKYIACDSRFESVDLTLFSTFPDLGLEVRGVTLVNPVEDAPSDTLLQAESLVVGIDLMAFLKENSIVVRQLQLDNVQTNLFVDAQGRSNFDIFPPSTDTTSSGTFNLPDSISLHTVAVHNLTATWTDRQHGMEASANGLDLSVEGGIGHGILRADVRLSGRKINMINGSGPASMAAADDLNLRLSTRGSQIAIGDEVSFGNLQADVNLECGGLSYHSGDEQQGRVVEISNMSLCLDAGGDRQSVSGRLLAAFPQALVQMDGQPFCGPNTATHGDLLALEIPFSVELDDHQVILDTAIVTLDGIYQLRTEGLVQWSDDQKPMFADMTFSTNPWRVASLMGMLPAHLTKGMRGMDLDAVIRLDGSCKGTVSDSLMANVTVRLDNGRWADARLLEGPVHDVTGILSAQLLPSSRTASPYRINAQVQKLHARWKNSDFQLDAQASDIMSHMPFRAHVLAHVLSDDLIPFLPDSLPLTFNSHATVKATVSGSMHQLQQQDWQHMQAELQLQLDEVALQLDSMQLATPNLTLAMQLHDGGPAPEVAFDLSTAMLGGRYGTLGGNANQLSLSGTACYDTTGKNIFEMLQPELHFQLSEATVYTPAIPQMLRLNDLRVSYADGNCDTIDASLICGLSDYNVQGHLEGIEDYLTRKEMLRGRIQFGSTYTDIDQLLSLFSGLGTDKDSLEAQKQEAPATANPFIVPRNIDLQVLTHIDRCMAFGNSLNNVAGNLTVNDGVVVVEQMGFVCKAARMQLTGVYRSPRFNHLFAGLDFHLLDIKIDELIEMIPTIDTLVPMLKAFKGNADFHLAAETYLFADYRPKMSTMLGAAAISGKDLVVLDNETFDKISSLLMFKKKTENKIDSLDVEMTVFRNELEVYPFLLNMDKYQVCVSGRHTLDNRCNYHLELLKSPLPVRLAVDVKGNLSKPKIELGSVRYANLFKPEKQNKLQERTMEIKRQVRQALERNVR